MSVSKVSISVCGRPGLAMIVVWPSVLGRLKSVMAQAPVKLKNLLQPTIESMGYELVGIEYVAQGKHSFLRIYIDKEDGIAIEDCEQVSRQVSGILDVEDPIQGEYRLEVSSPGLDRPIFYPEHYQRFCGKEVTIRLHTPLDGRRKFKGRIKQVEDTSVLVLETEQEDIRLDIANIEKANLVPEF